MTPSQAMLWQIWRCHRYLLMADAAYLLIAALTVQLLPASVLLVSEDQDGIPLAGRLLGLPTMLIIVHFISMFSVLGGDFNDFGFAPRSFVLPVKTRWLVAVPMIAGCLALTLLWLIIATCILWPANLPAPLLWPAALMAACMASVQAISWFPLAQTWLRAIIAVPLFLLVVGGAVVAIILLDSPRSLATELFVAVPMFLLVSLFYAVALRGLTLARRGDVFDWQLWRRFVAWLASWRKAPRRPFPSAAAAQLWFECRGLAWFIPTFVGPFMLFISMLLISVDRDNVTLGWRLLAIVWVLPILFAGALGGKLAARDAWSKFPLGPFIGTRPLATTSLVRIKLAMCFVSALITWAITLICLSTILLRPGFAASIYQVAHAIGFWKSTGLALLFFLAPIVLIWLLMASSLCVGLTGREWIVTVLVLVVQGLVGFGVLFGFWLFLHPEWQATAKAAVPWLTAFFIGLKLLAASLVSSALVRSQQLHPSTAANWLGCWSLAVIALFLVATWSLPSTLLITSTLLGSLVLLVPFSRLAAAPLALHWNRHR